MGLGLLGLAGWVLVAAATIVPGARLLALRHRLSEVELAAAASATAYLTFILCAATANNVWNRYVWLLVAFATLLASRLNIGRIQSAEKTVRSGNVASVTSQVQ